MARVVTHDRTLAGLERGLDRESRVLGRVWRMEAAAAAGFGLAAVAQWVWRGRASLALPAALTGLLATGHWWKMRENRGQAGAFRAGRRGESVVLRHLERLGEHAHILNDLVLRDGWHRHQIDHLVVTPGGVFVIETKAWSGVIEGSAAAASWTVTRPDGRRASRGNPIRQNRAHADLVRRRLRAWGEAGIEPQPVLVMTRGSVQVPDAPSPILSPAEVAGWIEARPPALDPEQARRLADHFAQEAR